MLDSFDKTTYAGLRNYIITLVMLDTGIRTSELIRLKDNDFDFGAKQIIISKTISKTRRHRIVYLSNSTATALANFIKIKPSVWEYIRELQKVAFDNACIIAERVALRLADIAFAEKGDEFYNISSQLKALDLLQKQLGLQHQKL